MKAAGKITRIVVAGQPGDRVDRQGRIAQQFLGACHALFREEGIEGTTGSLAEKRGEVIGR